MRAFPASAIQVFGLFRDFGELPDKVKEGNSETRRIGFLGRLTFLF
jgi:hypothetical protein